MIYTLDRFRKVGHHVVCHVILHDCMITCHVDPGNGLEFFTSTHFMWNFQEKLIFSGNRNFSGSMAIAGNT